MKAIERWCIPRGNTRLRLERENFSPAQRSCGTVGRMRQAMLQLALCAFGREARALDQQRHRIVEWHAASVKAYIHCESAGCSQKVEQAKQA